MNAKCTVVIPEHNRPLHLKRLLDFYLKYELNIIVTDSSDNEFLFRKDYEARIVYRHYPKMPLAEKINAINHLIETPFVFMCANDDFIVPETVNNIISFLESNIEYNSGQGIYIKFDPKNEEITPLLIYENMLKEKLDETKCTDRLNHLMGNYFQFYYAVFRTEVFKILYSSVIKEGKSVIKNLRLLEIYISCYSIIEGKHIIFQEFYGARESIYLSAGAMTDTMPSIVSSPKYREEYNWFINLLTEAISKKEFFLTDESGKFIHNAVQLYLNKYYPVRSRIKYLFIKFINKNIISGLERIIYYKRYKQFFNNIPDNISGMNYWIEIKKHIINYRYIYK